MYRDLTILDLDEAAKNDTSIFKVLRWGSGPCSKLSRMINKVCMAKLP